jgi:hypothetical protein
MSRELLQQALDALKQTFQFQQTRDVIAALEAELAKPEQEPVAWMWADGTVTTDPDRADGTWTKLYSLDEVTK